MRFDPRGSTSAAVVLLCVALTMACDGGEDVVVATPSPASTVTATPTPIVSATALPVGCDPALVTQDRVVDRMPSAVLESAGVSLPFSGGTNEWLYRNGQAHVGDVPGIPSAPDPVSIPGLVVTATSSSPFTTVKVAVYDATDTGLSSEVGIGGRRYWHIASHARPPLLASGGAECKVTFELPGAGEWLVIVSAKYSQGSVQFGAFVRVTES